MAAITNEQLEHFEHFGFVTAENLIDPERVIDPVVDEYAGVLDNLADELYEDGIIISKYEDFEFGDRVTQIYAESGEVYNGYFDFSLPQGAIKADTPFWAGPAVFDALTAPDLLDAVESFIGPEIYSNPVQHVRIKVPESRAPRDEKGMVKFGVTPWHQDAGVVNPDADESLILTVWFPLMDADAENGCLQVVPGSHREDLLTHCPGMKSSSPSGLQIPESEFEVGKAVPIPLKKGDVLFMTKFTIHSSLPNNSDRIRWSFDLRYNPIGHSTGRTSFPGFVARSRSNPGSELHDPVIWNEMWTEARDALAKGDEPSFNRWDGTDPVCA
ncbi:MAG: phytanoyl-CoA dioxygenase family protein [Chloroflexi bacterium]|nr:phytanoyl-CoA dioxygenase family protein [Chloroflexota bacterium]